MKLLFLAALTGAAAPVTAQGSDPATDPKCMTVRVALPPELAGWSERGAVRAAANWRLAPVLTIGRAADVSLRTRGFAPAVAPERKPAIGAPAGMLQFRVARPGTYRVALGGQAWIDVARRGHRIASSAHQMGRPCTGVFKMVDFKLAPGRYYLQLSNAAAPQLATMIVRLP